MSSHQYSFLDKHEVESKFENKTKAARAIKKKTDDKFVL